MCEGKTNLHPDVEVITVAEERKGEREEERRRNEMRDGSERMEMRDDETVW